ncbi:hypothetical protein C3L33_03342, partial [Rhododendron williamsianum]
MQTPGVKAKCLLTVAWHFLRSSFRRNVSSPVDDIVAYRFALQMFMVLRSYGNEYHVQLVESVVLGLSILMVAPYLRSKNWDTRVAAAHAIGAIAANVKHTSLVELCSCVEMKMSQAGIPGVAADVVACPRCEPKLLAGISFRSFDLNKVLEFGALLASGGQARAVFYIVSEPWTVLVLKPENVVVLKPESGAKSPMRTLTWRTQALTLRTPGRTWCLQPTPCNSLAVPLLSSGAQRAGGNAVISGDIDGELSPGLDTSFKEYDIASDNMKNPKERLARQKQSLRRRLGLELCEQFMDVNDMIRDEDLTVHKFDSHVNGVAKQFYAQHSLHNVHHLVSNMIPSYKSRRPSARELNLLKRKAKVSSKDQTRSKDGDIEVTYSQDLASPKGICPDSSSCNKLFSEPILDEDSFENDGEGGWPFHNFFEQLIIDMFDPVWEIRHGSGMALREVLTHQGACAGVVMPDPSSDGPLYSDTKDKRFGTTMKRERGMDLNVEGPEDETEPNPKRPKAEDSFSPLIDTMISGSSNGYFDACVKVEGHKDLDLVEAKGSCENNCSMRKMDILKNLPEDSELMNLVKLARHSWLKNWAFIQDSAIRFLCLLSLDRFGDYVSDQVVAPVRETCAQALGAVLKYMHPTLVHETLNMLLQMQCRPEWEIRHGSLLGIKYLVAVRQEMLNDLLGQVLPACKAGLEDPDDDVRAVAAEALLPSAAAIVSQNGPTLHSVVMLLWDILLDLDDLSPSTSSVMNLLAEIYSREEMIPKMSGAVTSKGKQEFDLNEMVGLDDPFEGTVRYENPYVLSTLAPRLWPFMRHSITSVRYSAIRTLVRYRSNLFEGCLNILCPCSVEDLEAAAKLYFSSWLELATTPYGSPLDATKMFWPAALPRKSHFKAAAKMRALKLESDSCVNATSDSAKATNIPQDRIGDPSSNPSKIIVGADVEMSVARTRVVTASALGILASKLQEGCMQYVVDSLWKALTSLSGVQRQVAAMVLISWFKEIKSRDLYGVNGFIPEFSNNFKNYLLDLLGCSDPAFPTKDSLLPYAELSRTYCKMRNEAGQLVRAVESSALLNNKGSTTKMDPESLTVDDAVSFASRLTLVNDTNGEESVGQSTVDERELLRQRLLTTAGYLKCVQSNLHVTVSSLVAAAVIWMSELPAKLNPIILPVMASIKREQEELLQKKAAEALAELISDCIARKPSPNDKLVKNICSLTCMDPCETPQAAALGSVDFIEDQYLISFGTSTSTSKQKSKVQTLASAEDRSRAEGYIADEIPKLWDCLTEVLKPGTLVGLASSDPNHTPLVIEPLKDPQTLINNIQVIRSIAPMLDETLRPKLLTLLPCIFNCISHSHVAVRLAASRCITSMAKSMTINVMAAVIENVIPMLGDMTSIYTRQGAGMLVSLLVQGLGVELVPYAPLLVVPLLRCMSDCDHLVRQSVTHSFAALVPLLPLARGLSPPTELSKGLSRSKEDAQFLEQLVDNSHIEDYKLSTELKVTLRSQDDQVDRCICIHRSAPGSTGDIDLLTYQQEGINWLAFLRRFNLHGVLCDDMGLGKTLQASAILASDVVEHRAANDGRDPPPSLIICPSTLVGHWVYEIEKFIDASVITTLRYVGSVQDRILLRSQFDGKNIIITSYDVVRKDVDYLEQLLWNYCVLDEGHIIKNHKSKITCAVKQLKAQHRLILSGTPIQFQATYGKPLLAARDAKCSAKDAEAGALAMEALHKQVMPFLLRRTKEEVLSDLPEKIIQDRYCDLTPVQVKLYEYFFGPLRQEISSMANQKEMDTGEGSASSGSTHIFQSLPYVMKICSHPLLVIGEKIPHSLSCLLSELFPANADIISELHKLHHSPKLVALQEILEECGIGVVASSSEGSSVTYLRLDGSVEPEKRFDIVKAFNSDPTIDALLLTTHVGGLGLNLTSADTVIFVENDWNPMRDLQAMDRAHRLGQRKVVNVHRLIMRGTMEERKMSLQEFKLMVANAVINAENASLKTMNTDQLLDLFATTETKK